MALPTIWSSHLSSPLDKKNFQEYILNSGQIFDRTVQILEAKRRAATNTSLSDYDSPSWSHRQADQNGYLRCLREMTELFTIK